MEKTAKNYCFYFLIGLLFSCSALAQRNDKTIVAKIENRFGNNNLVQYYVTEQPTFDYFTFSLEKMEFDQNFMHIYFFSEVNDTFQFFINDVKVKTEIVNTKGYDGRGKDPVVRIAFPEGQIEFSLKVTSTKHGSFETNTKRKYPMIYLHNDPNEWNITHSDVYRLPYKYFTRDPKN
jgi:hypothetical protein